jgi:hypothetical protein
MKSSTLGHNASKQKLLADLSSAARLSNTEQWFELEEDIADRKEKGNVTS